MDRGTGRGHYWPTTSEDTKTDSDVDRGRRSAGHQSTDTPDTNQPSTYHRPSHGSEASCGPHSDTSGEASLGQPVPGQDLQAPVMRPGLAPITVTRQSPMIALVSKMDQPLSPLTPQQTQSPSTPQTEAAMEVGAWGAVVIPPEFVKITQQKQRKGCRTKSQTCPICHDTCTGEGTPLRHQVLYKHLPWFFRPDLACWDCGRPFPGYGQWATHQTDEHPTGGMAGEEGLSRYWRYIGGLITLLELI